MDQEVSVSKVTIKGEKIYLKAIWDLTRFSITMWMYQNDCTWYGTMTHENFQELTEESPDPIEEHYNNFKSAIAKTDPEFQLDIRKIDDNNIELLIKKKHDQAISICGIIKLTKDQTSTKDDLIDYVMFRITDYEYNKKKLTDENQRLQDELDYTKSKWQEGVEVKDKMERELYTKFTELLNTKKKYINFLESTIRQHDS